MRAKTLFLFLARVLFLAIVPSAHAQAPDAAVEPAQLYVGYRIDIAGLGQAQLSAPGDVERALDQVARYKEEDLVRGWIAFSAENAANAPGFAAGIASVQKRYGRATVLKALAIDPAYPSRRRGYADAIDRVLELSFIDSRTARASAAHLDAEAAAHKLGWTAQIDGDTRAARLRTAPTGGWTLIPPLSPLVLSSHKPALRPAPAKATLARRIATLAAMKLLGGKPSDRLFDDKSTRECVHMQKLQFYQCVSVTHDASEGAQCLAEHALRGVDSCMAGAMVAR